MNLFTVFVSAWLAVIYASAPVGGGSGSPASDMRLKFDIVPYVGGQSSLDKVMKLALFKYSYLPQVEEGNATKIGFMAQQVEDVIPEAVGEWSEKYGLQSAKYLKLDVLIAELAGAVSELSRKVAHLDSQRM